MNSQKFKQWLVKIDSVNLEKPVENAKLQVLATEIQELNNKINRMFREVDHLMTCTQDQTNSKTSQLYTIDGLVKEKLNVFQRKKSKMMEEESMRIKAGNKLKTQLYDQVARSQKQLNHQLNDKNNGYIEKLSQQLASIKALRTEANEFKEGKHRNYEIWLENSTKKGDQILKSQEEDLLIIESYQKELLSRCDAIQQDFNYRLEEQNVSNIKKQKLLFRKLQAMLVDLNVE